MAAPLEVGLSLETQVSTHSHPKVAAFWDLVFLLLFVRFQHTATRRWLRAADISADRINGVSTHSHPKVAALGRDFALHELAVSTHSHPKVAADATLVANGQTWVSTHSHPKVAAPYIKKQ